MAVKRLEVVITGSATGAQRAMAETGRSAGNLSSKFSKFQKVAGTSFLLAGGAAVAFGKKSANTYKTISSDVAKLERLTGLTAEEASKLRFAFQQSGISVDAGARGLAAFSKKVSASKDGLKDFGFKVRDSKGNLLPMNELINAAADRLAGMKDGAEKNTLAMKLFGKGGLDMVKVLGKGSKGLAKVSEEAKKYGLVLTEDNVDAVKKTIAANRDQEAAYQGLQVQIGMHVLPLVTKLTTAFAKAIPKITAFMKRHKWVAKVIGGVVLVALAAYIASMGSAAAATLAATWPILAVVAAIGALVVGFKWAYENVGWFRDAVDKVTSFVTQTVIPAVKDFADWIGPKLSAGFAVASAYVTETLIPTLRRLWGWFNDNIVPILGTVARTAGWLLTQGFAVAKDAVGNLIDSVIRLWRWFNDNIVPALQLVARVASWLLTYAFGVAVEAVKGFIGVLSDLKAKIDTEIVPALNVTADVVSARVGFAFAAINDYLTTTFGPTLSALSSAINETVVPALGNAVGALQGQLLIAFSVVSTFVTGTLIPAFARLVNWLSEKVGGAVSGVAEIIGTQLTIAFTVASTFFGILKDAAKGLWRVLSDIVDVAGDVIDILGKIPGALNDAPGAGLVKKALHAAGVPGFAKGGRPPVGRPYLVGEKGPELRIDTRPGVIVSAQKTKQALSNVIHEDDPGWNWRTMGNRRRGPISTPRQTASFSSPSTTVTPYASKPTTSGPAITVNVFESKNARATAREVVAEIRRESRMGGSPLAGVRL